MHLREGGGASRTRFEAWHEDFTLRAMVLIVHGFPSAVAALRFEWAWQHPQASRRLAHVGPRLRSEAAFAFHLRVLAHMLRVPPWVRLPLTVCWLRADFRCDLCPPPPPHMPLTFGPPPPRAAAPKRRAGPLADLESEPDQDAEACCALCARSFQVSGSTWPSGFRRLGIQLFIEGPGSPLTPFALVSQMGMSLLAAIPQNQYPPAQGLCLSPLTVRLFPRLSVFIKCHLPLLHEVFLGSPSKTAILSCTLPCLFFFFF
ncbi:structure-specific endonuclease subunit SLX1 isoform X3 [Prionailurus viverrinus]|uniref:structure-specific endonuclease subunit SLX1 isoform X3 n=1 Tax=Prionailurus viverrinus TaxID=61388 RepID=UPI001FF5E7F4|nr:structure-specific endonuclease subunit SLX1 isoform X3 [Prionailurus viverrinus]